MRRCEIFDSIALAHYPASEEGLVLVMVCYLDDSDAEHSSVATLAGYVATIDNWRTIEDHLRTVCERYGVGTLHAKEFHDTKGDFKGWSRIKKNSFVDELYEKADHFTWGIAYSATKDWSNIKNQVQGNERISTYGVMFASILLKLVHGNPISSRFREYGLSFMVESGHRNNPEIEQYFHRMKSKDIFRGHLQSITFVDKHSSRSIQIADFLAFHARRRAALAAAKKLGVSMELDGIIKRIYDKVPHLEAILPEGMRVRTATFEEFKASEGKW